MRIQFDLIKAPILFLVLLLIGFQANAQNLDWARGMGGLSFDEGIAIAIDDTGNVYTTGYFQGIVDFDPNAGVNYLNAVGNKDIFIQKLDKEGNLIWAKNLGSGNDDIGYGIAVEKNGSVYITGAFQDTVDFNPGVGVAELISKGGLDIFVLKLDEAGGFQWAIGMGSAQDDEGQGIALDTVGNVYTIGSFEDSVNFDQSGGISSLSANGSTDIFIQKLDQEGNFIWAKQMGGTEDDIGHALTIDHLGHIYTTGTFEKTVDFDPGSGITNLIAVKFEDIFIQKLDAEGNFLWAKKIGSDGNDNGRAIFADSTGYVYTTGRFQKTADFDPNEGINQLTAYGSYDVFISKLDSDGNYQWAKKIGGGSSDYGFGISVDEFGNVYTTGGFLGLTDFDPNEGIHNISSNGSLDMFILILDSNGNLIWVKNIGEFSNEVGKAIIVDKSGNIYTTGYFSFIVDFDPNTGVSELTTFGLTDIFIQKLSPDNVGIENIHSQTLTLYPNPSSGLFHIDLPEQTQAAHLEISDRLGKKIHQQTVSPVQSQIDLSHLPKGLYQLVLSLNTGERFSEKLILAP